MFFSFFSFDFSTAALRTAWIVFLTIQSICWIFLHLFSFQFLFTSICWSPLSQPYRTVILRWGGGGTSGSARRGFKAKVKDFTRCEGLYNEKILSKWCFNIYGKFGATWGEMRGVKLGILRTSDVKYCHFVG